MLINHPEVWEVPGAVRQYFWERRIDANASLFPLFNGIWAADQGIGTHVDSTDKGKVTFVMILVSEGPHVLHYRDREIGPWLSNPLLPGKCFMFDARFPHRTICPSFKDRFVFLAWDMPPDYKLEKFFLEAKIEVCTLVANALNEETES